MLTDIYPVQWTGRRAVIALPEHIDVSTAGQIREELLSVINRGAKALIADLAATISCDHAGADALVRAYQRAVISGTELRIVVTAPNVRRMLSLNGLDRLVPIYPSLEAATAARAPATAIPVAAARPQEPTEVITVAVVWQLLDALHDGVALTDGDGTLALANLRLEEMFGYAHAELIGRPVESLVPAELQAAHRGHRAAYAQAPKARPMGAGARLVALRKDGTTFPAEVSLSPVATATGTFTLAVIRDVSEVRRLAGLADLARDAVAAKVNLSRELLDSITISLYDVGLSLQAAADLPHDAASNGIAEALRHLDGTIREIRDNAFTTRDQTTYPVIPLSRTPRRVTPRRGLPEEPGRPLRQGRGSACPLRAQSARGTLRARGLQLPPGYPVERGDGGVSRRQRLACRLIERTLPTRVDGRHRLDAPLLYRALTCSVAVQRVGNEAKGGLLCLRSSFLNSPRPRPPRSTARSIAFSEMSPAHPI